MKSVWKRKRFWLFIAVSLLAIWCLTVPSVQMILKTAPNKPRSVPASPALTYSNSASWEDAKPKLLLAMQDGLYGSYPSRLEIQEVSSQLSTETFDGKARIELKSYQLKNPINDETRNFGFVLVLPPDATGPYPIIMTQNFCPNHDVIKATDIPVPADLTFSCAGEGIGSKLMHFVFGRYIVSPPIVDILDRGYAIGVMHPPEFVPDSSELSADVRDRLFSNYDHDKQPGTLISWAAQSVLLAKELKGDARLNKVINWGHSRYGKSALLAAAFSPEIDGVIAHQSGTAGASLSRDKPGETLRDVVNGYPHWLGNNVSTANELPFDQHHLLALIAPRPVLLGNARRDVWSDPEGGFRAAKAATSIYGLYGSEGQTAPTLNMFVPTDDLSFWIRPGTHGVVKEDWPAFLDFLDAHFENE